MLRGRLEPRILGALVVVSLALWVFVGVADEVLEGDARAVDRALLLAMRVPGHPDTPLGPPWLQAAARDITALGSLTVLGLLVAATTLFLLLDRRRRTAGFVLLASTSGALASLVLKAGFARPRPALFPHGDYVVTASFPSGHAMLSTLVYLTLGALLTRVVAVRVLKVYVLGISLALAALVGISRVYLGVHWPTDVLAGWAAGGAWALLWWVGAELAASRRGVEA